MDYMTLKEAAEKWGVTPRSRRFFSSILNQRRPNTV